MRRIKAYYVDQVTDRIKEFPGRNRMIEGLHDLVPIVWPYMQDIDRMRLYKSRSLMGMLEELVDALKFDVTRKDALFNVKYDGSYYLEGVRFISDSDNIRIFPISFLFSLRMKNKSIYKMMIEGILILLEGRNFFDYGIDHDEYIFDDISSQLDDIDNEEKDFILYELDTYQHSPEIFEDLEKAPNFKTLEKRINEAKPRNVTDTLLKEICIRILALRECPVSYPTILEKVTNKYIENFFDGDEIAAFEEGFPVFPNDRLHVSWFSNQYYSDIYCSMTEATATQMGEIEVYIKRDVHSAKDVLALEKTFQDTYGDYIEQLQEIFKLMRMNLPLVYKTYGP